MPELLWLLLPVAALSGWIAARRSAPSAAPQKPLPSQYFQGINYLLNEQPDKAIEVFTRLVEVDSDTVETHLALGSLFRRRGEVDRAIRIHQNLIARPTLSRDQRAYAMLELGEDFMRAGLLDRAEHLFEQVAEVDTYVVPALRQLLTVYQQEKEWDRAISAALRLEASGAKSMRPLVAQFYCEQAEISRRNGDWSRTRQLLKRALQHDGRCVRASIMLADLEQRQGNHRAAIRALQRVERQNRAFLPEVLAPMRVSYRELGQTHAMAKYLYELLDDPNAGITAALLLTDMIYEERGEQAAVAFIADHLRRHPSIYTLEKLIQLNAIGAEGRRRRDIEILQELIGGLAKQGSGYECDVCGFTARALHWQCPSCRSWASVKPKRGENES